MADIKVGAKSYSGIKKLNFPLSDGSGYAQFSLGGSEAAEHSWNQIPELVRNFLDNVTYDPSDYTTSRIAEFAPATADLNNTYPIGKTIETGTGVLDRNGYEIAVQNGNTVLYNDIPNQYTEYVVRNGGAVSQAGTLKPTGALRQIKCVAKNVRDLGGWACDGGTVKYGKLFRGGELNGAVSISQEDKNIFIDQLNILAEVDFRLEGEAGVGSSPLGVEYKHFPWTWYDINDPDLIDAVRFIFEKVIAGIPTYFHCQAGADRTGCMAMICEAVCGVSQSDIDKDYEITSFYESRKRNSTGWTSWIGKFDSYSGSNIRDKVIDWLIKKCGITADEINAFRCELIDGTPETLTPTISNFSVTKSEINATISGDDTATQYQPYSADISVPSGYVLSEIKVMMGDADVTNSVFTGNRTTLNRSVTATVTNGKIDGRKWVIDGQGYVTDLIADEGYNFKDGNVEITMGGVDVSTFYSNGKIAIPNVTGDIVITANAVQSASEFVNVFNPDTAELNTRLSSSGATSAQNGSCLTDYIDISSIDKSGDVYMYMRGCGTPNATGNSQYFMGFDADKTKTSYAAAAAMANAWEQLGDGYGRLHVSTFASNVFGDSVKYIRMNFYPKDSGTVVLTGSDISDIVITINEPIV